MGGHEEVGQVVIVDVASDGLVATRGAVVLQDGFVVLRVNPNQLERSISKVGVGGTQVMDVGVGFGCVMNAGQVKLGGGIVVAADSDDGAGIQRGGREHVVVRWGWCAGSGRGGC